MTDNHVMRVVYAAGCVIHMRCPLCDRYVVQVHRPGGIEVTVFYHGAEPTATHLEPWTMAGAADPVDGPRLPEALRAAFERAMRSAGWDDKGEE